MTAIYSDQIRSYIQITESLEYIEPVVAPVEVEIVVVDEKDTMKQGLRDLVARLRSHMETEEGDFSLGVEYGMQMAADMIENLISRSEDDSEQEVIQSD